MKKLISSRFLAKLFWYAIHLFCIVIACIISISISWFPITHLLHDIMHVPFNIYLIWMTVATAIALPVGFIGYCILFETCRNIVIDVVEFLIKRREAKISNK